MTIHTELVTTPEAKPQDNTWPNQSLRKPQEGINFLSRMSDLPHSAFSTDPQKDKDGKQCSAVQLLPRGSSQHAGPCRAPLGRPQGISVTGQDKAGTAMTLTQLSTSPSIPATGFSADRLPSAWHRAGCRPVIL